MSAAEPAYPGRRLGLPERGPGSIARLGRRVLALLVDWACASVIAAAFLGYDPFALPAEAGFSQFAPLIVFAAVQVLFIPLVGGSPGHRVLGMRLTLATGGWTGLWRPIVRTLLLVFVIPAVIWDSDHRGLHDRAAGTVLVRA